VPGRYPETVRLGEGGPVAATFVCGFLGCDRRPFNPLLSTLPRRLHLPGLSSGWLHRLRARWWRNRARRRVGAASVLTRLAELMFVEVLRRYIETLPPGQHGWLAGLRDEVAAGAAMSRSAFADRFATLVGQPPMQYLAQWHMQLAARRLATDNAKVASIAEEVGYESEEAFSRAFKRVAPAAWRRGRARVAV
jgi:AraC-like DNA-binding protein